MPDKLTEIGRIAFRHEGEWWNAYWAQQGTMDGAIMLGSVRMSLVADSESCRNGFKDYMRTVLGDMISEVAGKDAEWTGERPAPEHEKAGRG